MKISTEGKIEKTSILIYIWWVASNDKEQIRYATATDNSSPIIKIGWVKKLIWATETWS